jgi:hypothetical protein
VARRVLSVRNATPQCRDVSLLLGETTMKNLFAALVVTASMTAFASEPVKAEAKPEAAAVKAEAKPEAAAVKAEAKPEVKAEAKPEAAPVKAEAKPEKAPAKKTKKVAAETK